MSSKRRILEQRPVTAPLAVKPNSYKMAWWATVPGICLGFLLPVLLLIAYLGEFHASAFTVRGHRFLSGQYIALGVGILIAIGIAGWMGQLIVSRTAKPAMAESLMFAAKPIGWIAVIVFCLWFKQYLFNPLILFQVLIGEIRPGRSEIGGAGGLESFLNFTPVFFSLVAYAIFVHRIQPDRMIKFLVAVLTLFTLYRVYLWSERLALIEVCIPVVFAWTLSRPVRLQRSWKLARNFGPYAGLPLLIGYFAAAEYVRSWQSAYYHDRMDYLNFALGRFATYYYTSLNNGAGVLATIPEPTYSFDSIALWAHKMPLLGSIFKTLTEMRARAVSGFLEEFGDKEFNNPSGLLYVPSDIGIPGAIIYFCVVAAIAGLLLRRYERGTVAGVVFFPLIFMTFLEIFRYAYLGSPRAFTYALGAGVACFAARWHMKQMVRTSSLTARRTTWILAPIANRRELSR